MKRREENGETFGFSVDKLQEICYFTHENTVPTECKIVCYVGMYLRAISFLRTNSFLSNNEVLFDSLTPGIRRRDLYDRILYILGQKPEVNKIDILRWCHDGFICVDLYNTTIENYKNRKMSLLLDHDDEPNLFCFEEMPFSSESSSSSHSPPPSLDSTSSSTFDIFR